MPFPIGSYISKGQTGFQQGSQNGLRKEKTTVTKSVGYLASGDGTDSNSNQILAIAGTDSDSVTTADAPRAITIQNSGRFPAVIMLGYQMYSDEDTTETPTVYVHSLLLPGETMTPVMRGIISTQGTNATNTHDSFADRSLWNLANPSYVLDYTAPNTALYIDSTADVDDGSGLDIIGQAAETKVFLEPYTSATNCTANLFRVGDLIRVQDEIMEVTAIGNKTDLANNYLTVIRGLYGSTAASDHADDAAIRLPFFNMH